MLSLQDKEKNVMQQIKQNSQQRRNEKKSIQEKYGYRDVCKWTSRKTKDCE